MRRETQNVLLVLLGGALVKISLDGTYLRYVRPSLLPLLLGAGVVIVAVGVAAIVFDIWGHRGAAAQAAGAGGEGRDREPGHSPGRADPTPDGLPGIGSVTTVDAASTSRSRAVDLVGAAGRATAAADEAPGPASGPAGAAQASGEARRAAPERADAALVHSGADGHGHGHGRSSWMLILPVLAILMVAPPALGSDSVQRAGDRSVITERPPSGGGLFGPLPEGDVPEMPITDVVMRSVWDASGALTGRQISVTGFLVRDEVDTQDATASAGTQAEPGAVHVARIRIMCCAADALPVKLRLDADGAEAATLAALPVDGWLEVTGEVRTGSATEANGNVPEFVVSGVTPVEAPADPYEY
ncbi:MULTISPECIES: TIGR03943 family putative permease subunit [Actinoalloteichus]|uniref:TIGR03943 family protein n=1 Tax=Actinoalloteichus fjordicus TaxID=1612552 RepID=A0AAC9PUE8_9PSEU|nr:MULTISPECIES: TIGR03943 family protein [Actinoalloteichus]APU16896.1 putative TIGR03943 family protein [Actinoalloteichus fjordicus]APU22976.1 putative TIGR03943 family protein [Actinoalloteichus sp. GBA129-24]